MFIPETVRKRRRIPLQYDKHVLKKRIAAAVCLSILPFAAYGLLVCLRFAYVKWAEPYLPPCVLRSFTGMLCPGCGMTHSFYALSRLDVPEAIRQNAAFPALCLLGIFYYAELWLRVIGKPRRLIPRRSGFVYALLAVWLAYCVVRNII